MSVSTTGGGGGAPALIGGCVVWTDVVWWRGCFVKPTLATAATSCLCVCWMVVLQQCLLLLVNFGLLLVFAKVPEWPSVWLVHSDVHGPVCGQMDKGDGRGQRHTDNVKACGVWMVGSC